MILVNPILFSWKFLAINNIHSLYKIFLQEFCVSGSYYVCSFMCCYVHSKNNLSIFFSFFFFSTGVSMGVTYTCLIVLFIHKTAVLTCSHMLTYYVLTCAYQSSYSLPLKCPSTKEVVVHLRNFTSGNNAYDYVVAIRIRAMGEETSVSLWKLKMSPF